MASPEPLAALDAPAADALLAGAQREHGKLRRARPEHPQVLPRQLVAATIAVTHFEQARAALKLALGRLRPTDTFNVIRFNHQTDALFTQAGLRLGLSQQAGAIAADQRHRAIVARGFKAKDQRHRAHLRAWSFWPIALIRQP